MAAKKKGLGRARKEEPVSGRPTHCTSVTHHELRREPTDTDVIGKYHIPVAEQGEKRERKEGGEVRRKREKEKREGSEKEMKMRMTN